MARHKWNMNLRHPPKGTVNHGGGATSCLKCGFIKEYVGGIPTYFRDDTVYDRIAPPCDERELKK